MANSRGSPSDSNFSRFRCEEMVITNVDKRMWTIDAESRHTAKKVNDIQCLVPYHHFEGGEGIHFLPEVGAICYIAWPSDNTAPFIMGFKGAASQVGSIDTEGDPQGSTATEATGSPSGVSFRSNRPNLLPGDIAMTTRDANFIILRRGGVLQLGATAVSQRIYIPILNYIKDFCENYSMSTFGGDIAWTVERSESDPSGNAPASYTFHMNEFAQDEKASVRVRHFPLAAPGGGEKAAWEVHVAKNNIDRDSGEVTSETYSLSILMDGSKTEVVGANYDLTIKGNQTVTVEGDRQVAVKGKEQHDVEGDYIVKAGPRVALEAMGVYLGPNASMPAVLGTPLMIWLSTHTHPVAGALASPPAAPPPNSILSQIVKLK
ncbi:MAG: hypothetical protein DRQ64_00010 [Gammaproteobacteria bacterium]|nr:MAG: hypothetical protein DRQ64_00010 [Gammaproteobacteria bacterium]